MVLQRPHILAFFFVLGGFRGFIGSLSIDMLMNEGSGNASWSAYLRHV